ncbi:type III pantothenate kinase [Paraglaciecola sp. L3A3]|uniref:type III pantothenate kinase n=1 Tax=Paraglaciecola sp. L3A3 TaxID=2686358 RepID=UPI00131C8E69|nr:type III pantothenate kinase [Paraglaciecola sp. L3A3]
MSVLNNTLLLDVGNTCIKYALSTNAVINTSGSIAQVQDLLPLITQVHTCYISAVGQKNKVETIQSLLENRQIDVYQIKTRAKFDGLTCAYKNPNRLGVDRWLAMLACRKKFNGNFAVLDFGTAMTCDVVNINGQHLGGWIAPGFNTMQVALLQQTQNLTVEQSLSTELSLGQDTEICINMGLLASMQGFLLSIEKYMQTEFVDYRIFIGGGNRHLLSQYMHGKNELFDNLVLVGMLAYSEIKET